MLDPWIIEEIRRREEEREREQSRNSVVIEAPPPPERQRPGTESVKPTDEEVPRGVTIIDFSVG